MVHSLSCELHSSLGVADLILFLCELFLFVEGSDRGKTGNSRKKTAGHRGMCCSFESLDLSFCFEEVYSHFVDNESNNNSWNYH